MEEFLWKEKLVGYSYHSKNCFYFFGTLHLLPENLSQIFPDFEFQFLKQVHGNKLIEAQSSNLIEADAHWTKEKNQALVIQTADCMPILMGGAGLVVAVHAGWKGVAQGIVFHSAEFMKSHSPQTEDILIGPHLQMESFEVGLDVAEKLQQSHEQILKSFYLTHDSSPELQQRSFVFSHKDPNKRYISLSEIARQQIQIHFSTGFHTKISQLNTSTNLIFHSFRRGKATPARQYSFIVRTS
ncbi:MAG: polyphenol oxidase family protein [Bdellovibrionales bacterium]|nr:polyphenol oxidase family protein [Bdellovibrionales bacterium]